MKKDPAFRIGLELLAGPPGALDGVEAPNFLQSRFWGRFKELSGWQPYSFRVSCGHGSGSALEFSLLVLIRPLVKGYSLAYVPHGPDPGTALPGDSCDCLEILAKELKPHLPPGCIFLRFDVPWGSKRDDEPPKALCKPFRKAAMDIQPPDTVLVDLRPDEEAILSGMKPKTRYNIRLSEKKGVRIVESSAAELDLWYALYEETAQRDGISLHKKSYYRDLFELANSFEGKRPAVKLLFAEVDGRKIAGIILAVFGGEAVYLYGASANEYRNYMASYALQWHAMKLAKSLKAETYDLFGIPPQDDPHHSMYGLYRFKTGFGGDILHRPGSYDYPLRFFVYFGYRTAEAFRSWYFRSFRKKFKKR